MTKLFKTIFDISVCYTIGAFLLNYVGGISIYGRSYLILLITALISILLGQKQKSKLIATILFPLLYLVFFLPAIPELVVFLLIWVYFSYVSITQRFVIIRGDFINILKRLLYLSFFLVFLMLTTFLNFSSAMQVAMPYLIMTLVSAVFLLRHLRAFNQMEQMKRYRRQQSLELLAFLVICLLLTLAKAPQNLMEGLKLMYQHLLVPILSFLVGIIGMLIGGIINLFIAAISFLTKNNDLAEVKIEFGDMKHQSIEITEAKATSAEWIVPFMYSIGAVIAMVFLFFFFRWLMGEKLKQNIPSGIMESREYLAEEKDKGAAFRKWRSKDSRTTVRYYYGKCLQWLQHKRVQLKPQDTTEEIDNKYYSSRQENLLVGSSSLHTDAFEAKREASKQLKQIYRKARYQMTEQITKEEAEKAKQLYQTIKNSKIK